MMDICLLGCGGMMPLPGRHLTSMLMRCNGSSVLIDCGEGTQVALRKKGWSFKPIDTICFTHYHGDHISGLPGLLLSMGNAERTEPLLLMGPKGLERVVKCLCVIAPELPFELRFHEIQGPEETMEMNGYRLCAFRVNHNVTCYGYTIELDRAGRFDPDRAREADIPLKYWSRLQKGETIRDGEHLWLPEMVLGAPRKGLKVTYVTDTRPTASIREHAAGSDLFICEGMYAEPEKRESAVTKKHMMFEEAAHLARDAGAGELWLTHFSPALAHPGDYLEETRKIFPETWLGKDGKSTVLRFADE